MPIHGLLGSGLWMLSPNICIVATVKTSHNFSLTDLKRFEGKNSAFSSC